MGHAKTQSGEVIHFPVSLATDANGFIIAPPDNELQALAETVRRGDLYIFARGLLNGARRRQGEPRWAAVNRARLKLAKHCIDRLLSAAGAPE